MQMSEHQLKAFTLYSAYKVTLSTDFIGQCIAFAKIFALNQVTRVFSLITDPALIDTRRLESDSRVGGVYRKNCFHLRLVFTNSLIPPPRPLAPATHPWLAEKSALRIFVHWIQIIFNLPW